MSSPAPVAVDQAVIAAPQPSVVSHPVQYVSSMPPVTYPVPQPIAYMTQPQVIQGGAVLAQPSAYIQAQPETAQQVTYVQTQPELAQQVTYMQAPHVVSHLGAGTEIPQPMAYAQAPQTYEVAAVSGEGGAIVSAPLLHASPEYTAQVPAVFNVSPEIFAKLAAGGTLTQEEMRQVTGGSSPDPIPAGQAGTETSASELLAPTSGVEVPPVPKKSKKSLKSKNKKSKGCC